MPKVNPAVSEKLADVLLIVAASPTGKKISPKLSGFSRASGIAHTEMVVFVEAAPAPTDPE